ncbi:CII family transcriptional regulator [Chimaeribacter arupi]|uniref:CII family transcriptional regulator n=1 Tax=Chimaeribacter arupi TaxID=2060066 RepID=UPI0029484896|nr:CII family transcriptional regulator [Chimaeribacter arupi]MDV5140832.1 CII family transcriptional regulator [Chimaeribacter arupi]
MDTATARNKARAIESKLLNKIAVRGVTNVAEAVGIDKSQISRWKESLIPRMSILLAVLEWGVEDEEMAILARQVAQILTKKKSPTVGAVEDSQITIEF